MGRQEWMRMMETFARARALMCYLRKVDHNNAVLGYTDLTASGSTIQESMAYKAGELLMAKMPKVGNRNVEK